ncbi:MAG: hypothetical protein LBU53_02200 [Zoogloeaceae bacterium]|nr:hypothetical protein [Zoogloeaceae bacterium]
MPHLSSRPDVAPPFFLWTFILCLGVFLASSVCAQPDSSIAADTRLLHDAPAGYVFERFDMLAQTKAVFDEARYRIYLGIPRKAPPPEGYPVIYALDGNAALDALRAQEALLEEIGVSASPPLLVLLGYETRARFDVVARTYDYTPPISGKASLEDLPGSGRKAGGADIFREFIATRLKPELHKKLRINPLRQTLWGHSYGGLFVLHTLFTHPEDFQHYIAISPSLWWQEGWILREAKAFGAQILPQTRTLLVLSGTDEADEKTQIPNVTRTEIQQARILQRGSIPKDSLPKLIEYLNVWSNVSARSVLFKGKTHGEMFSLGLEAALRFSLEKHLD